MTLQAILKYPSVFLIGVLVALFMTRFWGPRASRWGFVDRPGERKQHRAPVPTAGGIAVFLGFHAACALVFLFPWQPFSGQIGINWWYRLIPLTTGLVVLGMLDDRYVLKPGVKLAGQIVVATAAYMLNIRVQNVLGMTLPVYVDVVVTLLWLLALMNAFNLIDGIDGLAAGIALIASTGIAVSLVFRNAPGDVLLFLGFAGACAGFLRYNFYPARVFLGDTGSLFIGFTLAAMAISTQSKGPTLAAIGMPLLAVGVPLIDTLLAVWRRSVRGLNATESPKSFFMGVERADAEHLHHRLLRAAGGRNHKEVALLLYAGTAMLAGTGILVSVFHDRAMGILILAFLVGSYTVVRHLAWIELRDTGEAILQGVSRPVLRNRTMLGFLAGDLAILGVSLLASSALMGFYDHGSAGDIKRVWLRAAPMDVGIPFLFLTLFHSYTRVWHLARVSEFMLTGLAVILGYAVSASLRLIGAATDTETGLLLLRYWMMAGLSGPLIVGARALRRMVQDLLHFGAGHLPDEAAHAERAVIWGVGYRTTLFLRLCSFDATAKRKLRVMGAFSDDNAVRGHFVHGICVAGNLSHLAHFVREKKIQTLYIVEVVDDATRDRIRATLRGAGVRIIEWRITEAVLHD